MISLPRGFVTVLALSTTTFAQTPLPTKSAIIRSQDIRVHPFAQEFKDRKFKPNTREIPNELNVSRTDRIRIYGKRRNVDDVKVGGIPAGHFGQLPLLPPGERAGTITVKKVFGLAFFFAVFDMGNDTLASHQLKLKQGETYKWSAKTEGASTLLRVTAPDGSEVLAQRASTEKVLGIGFAATVRYGGNEVDLSITYNE